MRVEILLYSIERRIGMQRKLGLCLVLLSSVVAAGCFGNLSGTVTEDGVGLEGVTVVLSGKAYMVTVTQPGGLFVFENLKGGSYTVTMQPPAGYTRSVAVKVEKDYFVDVTGVNFAIETATDRQTTSGTVVGSTASNGAHAWLGIPFAKPPVEDLRWKAPLPEDSWGADTYLALGYGNPCLQVGTFKSDIPTGQIGGSEDCLYLNLWAPAFTPETIPTGTNRLPVMVWIHGGSNTYGHGGLYNGKDLAGDQDLIVITFNYRLGPLGWFTHPALASGNSFDDSGNYGTLDVIRVLHWVQDNISNFGGDPGNVTVFGESAGGGNTFSMILSQEAAGLFHKAVSESGGVGTVEMSYGQNYMDDPSEPGHVNSSREILNNLLIADGAPDRAAAKAIQDGMTDQEIEDYLYGKTGAEILKACVSGADNISAPTRFRDGVVLPAGDPLTLLEDTANYNAVPMILGSNRDEDKLYTIFNPDFVIIEAGLPVGAIDEAYYELHCSYASDAKKVRMVDSLAEILSETEGQPDVYAYRFDWDEEPLAYGLIDVSLLLGASHGLEISFVFNNFDQFMAPKFTSFVFSDSNLPGRLELGGGMSSYWAEFAYSGSPGFGRLGSQPVEWKAWDNSTGADKMIVFDTQADGGIAMSDYTITLQDLKDRLLAETGFTSQEQYCGMYVELFAGTDLWSDEEYADLGGEGCGDYPP
jgi:para-nitrobenzyl esterase